MQYLRAEKQVDQYYFQVLLDETSQNPQIREYTFLPNPPEGLTETEYVDSMKREIPLLVADELQRINAAIQPTTPLEGF
jgi:hypothetical protein